MRGEKLSLRRSRYHWPLYAFILPCAAFVGLFMYYPVVNGVYHSVYYWNGGDVERFYGLRNFIELFTNTPPAFWESFSNALILGAANILKMLPAIITAVCLHRVHSERLQFIYRALFVVPMVVPFTVLVLLWKAFYEPTQGVINVVLRDTGFLKALFFVSSTSQRTAEFLAADPAAPTGPASYLIGAAIGAAALFLLCWVFSDKDYGVTALLGYAAGLCVLHGRVIGNCAGGMTGEIVGGIAGAAAGGLVVLWRAGKTPASVRQLPTLDRGCILALGALIGAFGVSLIVGYTHGVFGWLAPLFPQGENPAWLGSPKLCMIALILWGFPWVASFSVLVYLATLQQIGREIYEAAEVDGADWYHKFRHIELPLITRQVRMMTILVIMGSINDAGMVMLMAGIHGGPGGVVQVPALFMFREAFMSQMMGYACAIGLVMFSIIVIMTKINEWLVKPGE
ncbi:MAG: sugar ABC transporter permease [Planctomycetota bacterium]|nr:sugar ABC transporter permease [Planctomycetota bacterium]